MNARVSVQKKPATSALPVQSNLLQRKCACGGVSGPTGKCDECSKKRVQRTTHHQSRLNSESSVVLPVVHEVFRSTGQPLDPNRHPFTHSRFGHDFSQVPVHFGSQRDSSKLSASPVSLGEGPDAKDVTQTPPPSTGTPIPAPADGGAVPTDAPAKTKKAKLKSGPTYSPSGTIKATKSGSKKKATFNLSAEFEHDPANGVDAASGEIRQYIKWTKASEMPKHDGFKPAADYSENTWYEDRDDVGKRYGHRGGSYSECVSINHYEDSKAKQDCVNGTVFKGEDAPVDGSGKKTSEWKFELRAVDTSDGDKEIGTPASVTLDWNV